MYKKILIITLVLWSGMAKAQIPALPAELLKENVSISLSINMQYCLGLLASGPLDFVNPYRNRWQIVNVNNTEGKNYYAFSYRDSRSYLCYLEGEKAFNTRIFKEGESLDRGAVFEVIKKGDDYLLYCIGTKTYLHLAGNKRGAKVDGVSEAKSATSWKLIPVPKDPEAFLKALKPLPTTTPSFNFVISDQAERQCLLLDDDKHVTWAKTPENNSNALWQFIPIEGFKDMYVVRNKATGMFLNIGSDGRLTCRTAKLSEAHIWLIRPSGEFITMKPVQRVFFDKPKAIRCGESINLLLIQRKN
jgi:hypothetical protein